MCNYLCRGENIPIFNFRPNCLTVLSKELTKGRKILTFNMTEIPSGIFFPLTTNCLSVFSFQVAWTKHCTPSSTRATSRGCPSCSLSPGKHWVAVSTKQCPSVWWASSTMMEHRSGLGTALVFCHQAPRRMTFHHKTH